LFVLFVVGNRLRQIRFDSEKLSPEQWDTIAGLTRFPEKAKAELEDYIGFYRSLRNDARQQYGSVSKRIKKVRHWEQEALRGLTNLMSSREFFPAIAMGIEHQVLIFDEELALIREWLKHTCEEKKKLLDWYDKALKRLGRSKRVPSSLFNLVRLLNGLFYKYTHQRISTGKTDDAFKYVLEVCRIAEPKLREKEDKGINTVHEVTKRVVTEVIEGEVAFAFDIEGWGHLIPYWRPTTKICIHDSRGTVEAEFDEERGHYMRVNIPKTIEGEGGIFILTPLYAPESQR
jgi:hypothetical protein